MLVGSGTKFLTELKIGDQINFIDDTGSSVTRIVQNIESNTRLQTVRDLGTAVATSRELVRQRTKLQDAITNKSIFKLPYDVVKTLLTSADVNVAVEGVVAPIVVLFIVLSVMLLVFIGIDNPVLLISPTKELLFLITILFKVSNGVLEAFI